MAETKQENVVYNQEYGISKGYLQKKKVYLKPIGTKQLTLMVKDKVNNVVNGFMYEDAIIERWLPMNERMQYFDPFLNSKGEHNDDEQSFFEAMLKTSLHLNHQKEDCIWNCGKDNTTRLLFPVSSTIKTIGYEFNMEKPEDVIKYKVAKAQYDIVTSGNEVKPHHTWILIDKETEDTAKFDSSKALMEAYKAFGAMEQHVEKMKEFLSLYILQNKKMESVPENMTQNALIVRVQELIEKDLKGFLAIVKDEDKEIKVLLYKAIKAGAINKLGINTYEIPGVYKGSFEDVVQTLKIAKENRDTDDTYDQVINRIELADGKLPTAGNKK